MSHSQELFIQSLAQRAYEDSKGIRDLGYKHVAEVIQTEDEFDFLRGLCISNPKNLT